MSQIIYVQSDESWMCVKNRFISMKSKPPFTHIEKTRRVSAADRWPEPVLIDECVSALYYGKNAQTPRT